MMRVFGKLLVGSALVASAAMAQSTYSPVSDAERSLQKQGYVYVRHNDVDYGSPRMTYYPVSGYDSEMAQPIKRWVRFAATSEATRKSALGGEWTRQTTRQESTIVELELYYVKRTVQTVETSYRDVQKNVPVRVYAGSPVKPTTPKPDTAVETH